MSARPTSAAPPAGRGAAPPSPPAAGSPRPGGFTLLEVILAVSLALILVAGVYAFFHHTLGVRRTVHRQADTVLAQRRILDMMAEDLRSALAYSTLQMGLAGDAESVSFARAVVPSLAVFTAPEAIQARPAPGAEPAYAAAGPEPQHDVQLVSYRLVRYVDEEGVEQIAGLQRSCQRTVTADTAEEGAEIEAVLLSRHVKFVRLQYWDGAGVYESPRDWPDAWNGRELPAAVRIALGTRPLEEGLEPEEYPYETAWRVVAIPAGGTVPERGRPADDEGGSP